MPFGEVSPTMGGLFEVDLSLFTLRKLGTRLKLGLRLIEVVAQLYARDKVVEGVGEGIPVVLV